MRGALKRPFKNLGDGGVAGDLTSEFATGRVGAHDYCQPVQANDRGDPRLRLDVAGKRALLFGRNGVLIGAKGRHVGDDAEILTFRSSADRIEVGPLASRHTKDRPERVEPLGSLGWIAIVCSPCAVEPRGGSEFWSMPPLRCRWNGSPISRRPVHPSHFGPARHARFSSPSFAHATVARSEITSPLPSTPFVSGAPKLRKTSYLS